MTTSDHTNPAWTLKRFAQWYLGEGKELRIKPPGQNAIRVTHRSSELVLFKQAPFQAVLVMLFPGYHVPPHFHRHVDSYDLILTGDGEAHVGGRKWTKKIQDKPRLDLRIPVLANVIHHGYTERGSAFLSLQKWHDVEPGFLSEDWVHADIP